MLRKSSLKQVLFQKTKSLPLWPSRQYLLLLLFFSIIIQTGKHFWPEFAFVSGVRVDYLSPTLYFSDIVILLLLILEIAESERRRLVLFGFFCLLVILMYVPFVEEIGTHLYGGLLLVKFIFVGFVSSKYFERIDRRLFLVVLAFATLIVSLLGIGQFFLQSSVQGVFYILGERSINAGSIGAATFSAQGHEILRSYGTFPHPNVFAFYLLFSCVFLLFAIGQHGEKIFKISLFLGSVAILFTFSRIIIFVYLITLLYFLFSRGRRFVGLGLIAVVGIFFMIYIQRVSFASLLRDWGLREELLRAGVHDVFSNVIFGSGMMQYFYSEFENFKTISPIFLQPVHSIYLLAWEQLGLFGVGGLIFVLVKSVVATLGRIRESGDFVDTALFVILLSAIFVGFFDHFLLTLQQGQLMLAVIVGMAVRAASDKE